MRMQIALILVKTNSGVIPEIEPGFKPFKLQ